MSMVPMPFGHITEEQEIWFDRAGKEFKIEEMNSFHVFSVVHMLGKYRAKIPKMMTTRMIKIKEDHPEYFL